MKRLLLIFVCLGSCTTPHQADQTDLLLLKENLIHAEKQLNQQALLVKKLEMEIALKEIAHIEKELEKLNVEKESTLSDEQWSNLFVPQRQILSHIIENMPECRAVAQQILDQVLTLITQLSDQQESIL